MTSLIAECRMELAAVVLALQEGAPAILTLKDGAALPSGPLETSHTSLQKALREWVERQTDYRLSRVEQLYTFGDLVATSPFPTPARLVRISYLALVCEARCTSEWRGCYDYLPWEDRRGKKSALILKNIEARLSLWAGEDREKREHCKTLFGFEGGFWNAEKALERYELLWKAGLVPEAPHYKDAILGGASMQWDHRRIVATALSRIRAKIRYTASVFDLLPQNFTLLQLQQAMEAVSGLEMHKQNFRRLVLKQELVEKLTEKDSGEQGRPAHLYRFRREATDNCYLAGATLPPF